MNSKNPICPAILAGLLILAILGLSPGVVPAQPVTARPDAVIRPTLQLEVSPAQVRTWKEMEAAAAAEAAGPARPPWVKKFRPTIGAAAYKAHKAAAAQTKALPAPAAPALESVAPLAPTVLSNTINFDGVNSGAAQVRPATSIRRTPMGRSASTILWRSPIPTSIFIRRPHPTPGLMAVAMACL